MYCIVIAYIVYMADFTKSCEAVQDKLCGPLGKHCE